MRLRCTVARPDGTSTDLEVRAPRSTPATDVARAVADATATDPGRLRVSGRALDDHVPVGLPPLVHGAVLTMAPVDLAAPGHASASDRPAARRHRGRDGLLEIRVVSGPDSGSTYRVGPGTHRVGRAPGCEVRVEDAACSRVHALLDVAHSGVVVRDAGSTNGTTVDGVPVDAAGDDGAGDDRAGGDGAGDDGATRWGTPLPVGARLRVGDTTVEVHPVTDDPAPLRRCGDGTLALRRSARRRPPATDRVVAVPDPPSEPGRSRVPWVGAALPLVVSVPLAFWWGPVALLIGLTGPLVVLGSAWHDRRVARADHRSALADHVAAAAAAEELVATALSDEVADRREAAPDPAVLGRRAAGRGRRTWERGRGDDDVLVLRLGTGCIPARTRRRAADGPGTAPTLDDAPVTLPLPAVGVLGVAGPDPLRRALLRWLVAQVAVLHSPVDVRVHVVAPGADGWAWTGWLPHTTPPAGARCTATVAADRDQAVRRVDELARLVRERSQGGPGADDPWVVLLVDGARRLADVPGLATVLGEGPRVRVVTICGDTTTARLPAECGAVARADDTGRLLLRVPGEPDCDAVVPDGVGATWCEATARGLAPLRDETADDGTGGGLPPCVHLLELLSRSGLDATDPAAVARSWLRQPRATRVVLGSATSGPWSVDLRTDGPHVLVGGTTGAGKSEMLQTLVASLALANRPEEMSFVLVDFKGGAAFGACATLPHTAGLVTDLDAHLTARALESLATEVRRRERALAGAGVADLEAYQRLADTDGVPPLARLVIVVDEYRALAEELPDLMDSLVRLAAVGRSLGIHLVLATQRPAGVVGADLRANVNLRIALRVRDAADSTDVVESPAAAALDPEAPGRALARTGGGPLVPVQVARVAGRAARRDGRSVEVRRLGWATLGDPPDRGTSQEDTVRPGPTGPDPAGDDTGGTATDLALVVRAVRAAAEHVAARPPAGPWLPPLPDRLARPGPPMPGPSETEREAATGRSAPDTAPALTLGVVDLPGQQARGPLCWDLAAGVVVAGSPRSGRTGLVRAVLAAVAACSPDDVHVHLLTGGGAPPHLETLPHVGTVVGAEDPARATRLLERLAEEVGRRRAAAGRAVGPRVLLIVDGAEQLVPALEGHDGGRGVDVLLDVLRSGPGSGVLTLLAGDRSVLTGRLGGTTPHRWLLRLADPTDVVLAGVPARAVPARQPPGRLLRLGPDGIHEAQVYDVDDAAVAAAFAAAVARSEREVRPVDSRPLRVGRLPDHLTLGRLLQDDADLTHPRGDGPDPLRTVVVGVGGPDANPVGLDLGASAALVAGVAGSGRSTVLDVAAAVVRRRGGRVVTVRPRPRPRPGSGSGSPAGPGRLELDGADAVALREAVDPEHGATLVVVDDVSLIQDRPAEDVLLTVADTWDRHGSGLLVAGTTSSLTGRYRGLAALARRSGCGVLLGAAAPADGDLLSVALPRAGAGPAGRGYLVRHGVVERIQVADIATDAADGTPADGTGTADHVVDCG